MCIRDRIRYAASAPASLAGGNDDSLVSLAGMAGAEPVLEPVSFTHLTLPTSDLV